MFAYCGNGVYFVPPTYLYVLHHTRGAQLYVKGYKFQFSNALNCQSVLPQYVLEFCTATRTLRLIGNYFKYWLPRQEAPGMIDEKRKFFSVSLSLLIYCWGRLTSFHRKWAN